MSPDTQDDTRLPPSDADVPLGLRLRRAREAAGLAVAEVAEKLRLKSATIEAMECENFDALGADVYVRGYFNSYARLVGVPVVLVETVFSRRAAPPPQLHTTARISHSRYLFDRYARRGVYLVLTASIVVPVILLATKDQLPRQGATLTPLDAPVVVDAVAGEDGLPGTSPTAAAPLLTRSAGENPVIASLGPFLPQSAQAPAPAPAPAPEHGLSLVLSGDSWVEVLDHEGRRLEHGVLRAGETRRFDPAQVGKVSLGNAEAVEVRMNGTPTDIAAFRRANVARFTVSSDGSLAPAGG